MLIKDDQCIHFSSGSKTQDEPTQKTCLLSSRTLVGTNSFHILERI